MPYDPNLVRKIRQESGAGPSTGYNPEMIAKIRGESAEPPAPSMAQRFKAGFMEKDIPQPEGFERGDIAEFAGRAGLETLGGAIMTPLGPGAVALGAGAGKALHEGIRRGIGAFSPESTEMGTSADVIKKVGQEAALQGLGAKYMPSVFKGVGMAASKVASVVGGGAEKLSTRMVNSLIKPKMMDFIYGKNPGKGVADEGIVATSLEDLVGKITAKKQELGSLYGPLIQQNQGKVIDLSGGLKPIDDAIAKVSNYPEVNKEVITRLEGVRRDLQQNLINRDSSGNWGLTPENAVALKREIGEITKFTGNQSDDAVVNKALKQVYGYIDGKLDEAIPGIEQLNERYANILGAESAAKWRAALMSRQDMTHLPEMMTGGAAGLMTGSVIPGLAVAGLHKTLASTPAKTIGAQAFRGLGAGFGMVARGAEDVAGSQGLGYLAKYSSPAVVSSTEELMRKYLEQK